MSGWLCEEREVAQAPWQPPVIVHIDVGLPPLVTGGQNGKEKGVNSEIWWKNVVNTNLTHWASKCQLEGTSHPIHNINNVPSAYIL